MTSRCGVIAVVCGLWLGTTLARGQEIAAPLPAYPAAEPVDFDGSPAPADPGWVRGDYLMGWFRRGTLGNLVTTSPAGTDRTQAGVLGQPGTSPLFGGVAYDNLRSGVQISAGMPLNNEPRRSLELGFLLFDDDSANFSATSTGDPILARPIVNALNGQPEAVLIAFPGVATGSINVLAQSRAFFQTYVDFTEAFVDTGSFRMESMIGYRFFRYAERLRISQSVQPGLPTVPGTTIDSTDDFGTRNHFHGIDLGLRGTFVFDNFTVSLLAKTAAGRNLRRVDIQGRQVTTVPGAASVEQTGGLLALSSNIGSYNRDDWSVVPELGVDVGWQLSPRLRVHAGYNFMYMTRLARAADQIDFTVNPNLFPGGTAAGAASPQFNFRANDLWIQSLRFGLELTF